MIRKFALALALGASGLAAPTTIAAQAAQAAPADPERLKLAEVMAEKIIPPGSYQKMMKVMADQMADGMIAQMMGMDAAIFADAAANEATSVEGKSLGDLASQADPHFKERMDIMMKVMFDEMGKLMTEMETPARNALAKVYARKYSAEQMTDMNRFFATPSGAAFAGDFMATFSDAEMIEAMMGQMPKMMEAMPAIMKKVEEATAHLPPAPKTAELSAIDVAVFDGEEPWWNPDNWDATDRKKYNAILARYEKANEAVEKQSIAMNEVMEAAAEKAKARYLAEGWKATPPQPDPFDAEQLETLKKAWSAADNAAVSAQTRTYDAAADTYEKTSQTFSREQSILYAGYYQAMINAGQVEGDEKRSAADAMKAAADVYDSDAATAGAADAGATAVPGDTNSADAERPSLHQEPMT